MAFGAGVEAKTLSGHSGKWDVSTVLLVHMNVQKYLMPLQVGCVFPLARKADVYSPRSTARLTARMGASRSSTCFNTLLSPANICINKYLIDGGNNTHSLTLSCQMVWVQSSPLKSHSAHCNVVKCQHCTLHTWLTGVADFSREANDHWWAAQHQQRLLGANLHSWELASTWDTCRIYAAAQCTKNSVGYKLKTTSNLESKFSQLRGRNSSRQKRLRWRQVMKYTTCHISLYVSLVHLVANHNYSNDLPL